MQNENQEQTQDQETQEQNQAPATAAPAQPQKRQAPKHQPSPKAPAGSPAAPVQSKMAMPRNRHDVAFRHDVFVSDVKKCIKNVSYEFMKFERVDVEHKHIYHSHNNNGKKLHRTNTSNGHWHNVEHYVDPVTGATMAKCGPAMHEVTKTTARGNVITVIEPVSFEHELEVGENKGEVVKVIDNHTHELEYLGSEDLSPLGIQNGLKEQRALAAAMGINIDPKAVKDNTPAPMSPADGATIT